MVPPWLRVTKKGQQSPWLMPDGLWGFVEPLLSGRRSAEPAWSRSPWTWRMHLVHHLAELGRRAVPQRVQPGTPQFQAGGHAAVALGQ